MANIGSVFHHAIKRAEKSATVGYTEKLRSHASSYGWPSEITDHIKISYNDSGHSISYPKGIEDAVLTLEYGNQTTPPAPALRTFVLGIK